MNKGEDWWKNQLKEGGIVALAGLMITLSLTVWLIVEFLVHHAEFGAQGTILDWIHFEVLEANGEWATSTLSFGLWIDSVSLTVLFVAAFLCFPHLLVRHWIHDDRSSERRSKPSLLR